MYRGATLFFISIFVLGGVFLSYKNVFSQSSFSFQNLFSSLSQNNVSPKIFSIDRKSASPSGQINIIGSSLNAEGLIFEIGSKKATVLSSDASGTYLSLVLAPDVSLGNSQILIKDKSNKVIGRSNDYLSITKEVVNIPKIASITPNSATLLDNTSFELKGSFLGDVTIVSTLGFIEKKSLQQSLYFKLSEFSLFNDISKAISKTGTSFKLPVYISDQNGFSNTVEITINIKK